MVINFDGIRSKKDDLSVCIENYSPDVIICTETHLDSSILSSEIFPQSYSVIRKDRDNGRSKGGVCIAIRDDLIITDRSDLNSDCEAVWVTLKVKGVKDLTIGAFYRSQIFGDTTEYMDALRQSITKIRRSSKGPIWLAGDFNFPTINWDNRTVYPAGRDNRTVNPAGRPLCHPF